MIVAVSSSPSSALVRLRLGDHDRLPGPVTLYTLRFLMPNVLMEPSSKVKVGFPESFEEGKVIEKFKDQNIWVVRNEGKIYASAPPAPTSGVRRTGSKAPPSSNAPATAAASTSPASTSRALPPAAGALVPRRRDDGQIVVDKSKKFQQERGEWVNPESFITV